MRAFMVWLGLVTGTRPRAHPAPYLRSSLRASPHCRGCTSIHFGENQLSPGSVGISPLATGHPPVLQHGGFGPRRGLTPASPCPWIAHPVSGLIPATVARPVQTPLPSLSLRLHGSLRRLTWAAEMNSPDHSTKGTPSARHPEGWHRPPTACRCWVSGSLSSPLRGAFHLSLTVLVRYRWPSVCTALEGGPPCFPQDFSCPVVLGYAADRITTSAFAYGALTRSGAASQAASARPSPWTWIAPAAPHNPARPRRTPGLGQTRFARRYSGPLTLDFSSSRY